MKVRIQKRHSNFSLEDSVAEIIPTKYEIKKRKEMEENNTMLASSGNHKDRLFCQIHFMWRTKL